MNDSEDQLLMSYLSPPSGDGLGRYLAAVERALGARSDAELASIMGVAPTSIANWKRRGYVPPEHSGWFLHSLVPRILRSWADIPQVSRPARSAVVQVIARSFGNPSSATRFTLSETDSILGGLFALSEFVATMHGTAPQSLNSDDVKVITEALQSALRGFREAAVTSGEFAYQ